MKDVHFLFVYTAQNEDLCGFSQCKNVPEQVMRLTRRRRKEKKKNKKKKSQSCKSSVMLLPFIPFICFVPFLKVPETKIGEFANSVDLDEVAHDEPPHLDLHCLPSSL